MHRRRWDRATGFIALVGACTLSGGCRVDEITFGVGDARTEDSFGNPVVRPYEEDDGLRLYRIEIEREKDDEEPG